jgi:hypothetical protein
MIFTSTLKSDNWQNLPKKLSAKVDIFPRAVNRPVSGKKGRPGDAKKSPDEEKK